MELLCLPKGQPCYLLDIGCGSGLSGDDLSDAGHCWVGIGISPAMLDAALDRDTEGDLLLGDMGQGIPFKPGSSDGCISLSALQWLCNANKRSDIPAKRLYCFFSSLYSVLVSMRSPTCLGWLFIPPVDSDGVGSIPREGHSRRPARGRRTLWLFLSRSKP